jgi:predicted nucleotidyltransferase component of viral defense system
MLTTNQLRQIAARTAARDIGNIEIDVVLTYLLQLFYEKGLTAILAFKGGTMLRKMVFGARGRLSTDIHREVVETLHEFCLPGPGKEFDTYPETPVTKILLWSQ